MIKVQKWQFDHNNEKWIPVRKFEVLETKYKEQLEKRARINYFYRYTADGMEDILSLSSDLFD